MEDDLIEPARATPEPQTREPELGGRIRYQGTGEPTNALAGVGGNSMLPGEANSPKERRMRGSNKRFNPYPSRWAKSAPMTKRQKVYDKQKIYDEYMESPVVEWHAYCATKGYNSDVQQFPWKQWVRQKKYRNTWHTVRDEIENEGIGLGPRTLLRQVKAIRQVPEALAGMLHLLQHALRTHMIEVNADQVAWRKAESTGEIPEQRHLKFSLSASDLLMLSTALKTTGEFLYKSLGIDQSVGVSASKWVQMVEDELQRADGDLLLKEAGNVVSVEAMGAESVQDAIRLVMENYLDKPAQQKLVASSAPPEGLGDGLERGDCEDMVASEDEAEDNFAIEQQRRH